MDKILTQQIILPKGIKMQFKNFAFFAILATLLFNGCGDSKVSEDGIKQTKTTTDRKVFLTTTQNTVLSTTKTKEIFKIKEFEGKAVLVNFFATWCPPCKAEIPHLNNLRKKYNENFEIVGVLLEQNKKNDELQNFINEFKIEYPVTNSDKNYELAKVLGGVQSIPTMFMVDKNGKIIQKYVGIVPEEMLEMDIKKAIK